jgi:hypothetical protein
MTEADVFKHSTRSLYHGKDAPMSAHIATATR